MPMRRIQRKPARSRPPSAARRRRRADRPGQSRQQNSSRQPHGIAMRVSERMHLADCVAKSQEPYPDRRVGQQAYL
eukprot:4082565-Pleurochrysis_carterae.AAC.1